MFDKSLHIMANFIVLSFIILFIIKEMDTNYDIINKIIPSVFTLRNKDPSKSYQKILLFIVGLCAIYLMLKRNTFLTFLDESVVPSSLFTEINNNDEKILNDIKNMTISVDIYAPNADKVIWWASNPITQSNTDDKLNGYEKAYDEYKNSGVAKVQKDGNAHITLPCPQQYSVNNKILKKHLHYREASGPMLSEVKTMYLNC
jgi:hypothetical protein